MSEARLQSRTSILVRLAFLAAAALALGPALARPGLYANRYDWRYFESMGEISRRAVLWWHQAPLWNPYSCGGEVALANPQSLDTAPSFLLVLLFGVAVGYKLALVLYHFAALDGAFRLARRFGASLQGALLAAFGYGLSGWLALHFSEGHVTFIGVTLYPYLLLCYDRAVDEPEWTIPTGLVAAWILSLGGTFTPPMAAELLGLWAILRAIERRSLRPFALLVVAGAVTLACLAVRMFPVLQFIKDHPRPPFMRATDWLWPWQLLQDLVAWRELAPVVGRKYWAHEYTARLPWLIAPLWAIALVLPLTKRIPVEKRRSARDLWVLAIAGGLMAMGNFSPVAPWSLLQRLPVLRDLRVPSRHMILVLLALAPLCGLVWDWVVARSAAPARVRRIGWALVALVALDGALFTAWQYRDPDAKQGLEAISRTLRAPLCRFDKKICARSPDQQPAVFGAPLSLPAAPPRFYQVNGSWRSMRETFFDGHGSIRPSSSREAECDEEAPLQRAEELDPGDVPQERLLDPTAGEIVESTWTPNVRTVVIDLRAPTTLLVNSNWNEHWHVDGEAGEAGPRVTKVAGRLAVDLAKLSPGRHTIVVRYAPRAFYAGVAVSAIALPLCLGIFLAARRRRRAAA